MVEIKFAVAEGQQFSPTVRDIIKAAAQAVWGEDETFAFVPSLPGAGVIGFGVDSGVRTISPEQIATYPGPVGFLVAAFCRYAGLPPQTPFDCPDDRVLYLDIETHSVDDRWSMKPFDFFRLGQYAWGPTGEVQFITDYWQLLDLVRSAGGVVAHNGHAFDFSVIFGVDSTEALEMALENKLFDTQVFAVLNCPAPDIYTNREGSTLYGNVKPLATLKWLGLDNLCFQFGVEGKVGDLSALAKKYGGFGSIPLDDPEFEEYARQDVIALQSLTAAMMYYAPPTEYDWREQLNAAIDAQNSRNGFKVDVPAATARAQFLTARKEEVLEDLRARYDFPTQGAQPWRSNVGKAAILRALSDQGIVPENIEGWTKTKTGAISLGGEVLLEQTAGTGAEDLGVALAELMGQRTLAQLALASVQPDGKAHPEITSVQRSGRKSTTKPGLTVWSSRGDKAIEKSYFVPDTEDEVLVEFDFSQADQRIVAALSGDEDFKERFAEGSDAHELTGRVVFGDDLYDSDPYKYRQIAKALGHAYAYRAGPKKLAATSKQSYEVALMFVQKMTRAYRTMVRWQEDVTLEGEMGMVVNDWGRRMQVDPQRSYTQAPAMYGQSGTREIMVDALIRMTRHDLRIIRCLVAQVHDALVFSIPKVDVEWMVPKIKELMECNWGPKNGGQVIHFPVGVGNPGKNWTEASH